MKRMPVWLKWGVLALLAVSAAVPILERTVLEPRGLTWRAGIGRCCTLFLTLDAIALLVWTGVLLWRKPTNALHRWAVVVSIGLLCLMAGGIGRFMVRVSIPYERVTERDGRWVVEESPPLDSGSNYYDYHGPFVRGTELLEGSFYLELFGSGEGG